MEKLVTGGVVFIVLGFIILIFSAPFGGLMIFIGAVLLILGIYSIIKFNKESNKKQDEPSHYNTSTLKPAPIAKQDKMLITKSLSIKGTNESIMEYASFNDDIKLDYDDIKSMYERGERVYEYEISINKGITIPAEDAEKITLMVDEKKAGYLNAKDSDEYRRLKTQYGIKDLLIEGYAGRFMKVTRNENYDPEMDDEEEKNWVEWDSLSKPKINLIVRYEKER